MSHLLPTLIFDLDNTLVECGQYYLSAQVELIRRQSVRTDIKPEIIKELFTTIDLQSTKLERGFSRDRFPRSFSATVAVLDAMRGRTPDNDEMKAMWLIGDDVFYAPYTPYDGVESTLQAYKDGGWQLLLCSKGQYEVQKRKIAINGFERFFDPTEQYITLVKSPEYLQQIIVAKQIDVGNSWYIGDSMRDDIGPALAVGMKAVEVASGTGKWAYENIEHPPTATITSVSELGTIIPTIAPGRPEPAIAGESRPVT